MSTSLCHAAIIKLLYHGWPAIRLMRAEDDDPRATASLMEVQVKYTCLLSYRRDSACPARWRCSLPLGPRSRAAQPPSRLGNFPHGHLPCPGETSVWTYAYKKKVSKISVKAQPTRVHETRFECGWCESLLEKKPACCGFFLTPWDIAYIHTDTHDHMHTLRLHGYYAITRS